MLMIQFLLLFLSFFGSPVAGDHEFHMSKCEVAFNESDSAIQVSLHLFIDDLEEGLAAKGHKNLKICTDKEAPDAEEYMAAYLQENFTIKVNGDSLAYTFIGKEESEDLLAVWCYLEIENITSINQLTIKNKILTSIFEDQKNIVSVSTTSEGRKGYFLFDAKNIEDSVSF